MKDMIEEKKRIMEKVRARIALAQTLPPETNKRVSRRPRTSLDEVCNTQAKADFLMFQIKYLEEKHRQKERALS
jgi:hypothetical protein